MVFGVSDIHDRTAQNNDMTDRCLIRIVINIYTIIYSISRQISSIGTYLPTSVAIKLLRLGTTCTNTTLKNCT